MTDKSYNGLPPHVVQNIMLEGIFMPEARKHRDKVYTEGKRFVHYTSADSALKIINTKRLWLRNTMCMSDYREVLHGYEMLTNCFFNRDKFDAFGAALDACAPGVQLREEAIRLFSNWWPATQTHTYVSSISEHEEYENQHGRLSMWRSGFDGTTAKVAIILRIPKYTGGA